ncbi:MAG: tetratricopeptide repeat protein [Candidatus Marinimicrobia bacterium]|nr:tetratricopeptide repeat protein [Candidatus Neomarinimicrobiota bacterium]
MKNRIKIKSIVVISLVLTLSSCAYFNTFYNAKQLFNESQKKYGNEEKKLNLSQDTKKSLNEASAKAKKVMQKYPKTKYADDAMYYYGVCNFQLGKYLIAQKQLSELILNYPQSEYRQEAQLWIAKCYFRQNKKELAFSLLENFIKDKRNRQYYGQAMSLAGYLALEEGDDKKTFSYFNQAIKTTRDRVEKSILLYDLAVIYTNKNKFKNAIIKLKEAEKYSKDPAFLLDIKLQYIRVYRLKKQYNKSYAIIKKMLKTIEYEKIWPELEVELGLIFYNKNYEQKAIKKYKEIIEKYKNTPSSSLSSYYLGEIYLYDKLDFKNAKKYYGKVKGKDQQDNDDIINVDEKKNQINKYMKIESNRKKTEKKEKHLIQSPIDYYNALSGNLDTNYTLIDSSKLDTTYDFSVQIDSILALKLNDFKKTANEYGEVRFNEAEYFVFYFKSPDSALTIYNNITQNFPYIDIMPQILNTWAYVLETDKNDTLKADSLRNVMVTNFPNSYLTYHFLGQENPDSLKYKSNQKKIYEIEKNYINEEEYIKAIDNLKYIIESDSLDSVSMAHSYYKIAWLYDYELIEIDSTIDDAMKYYKIVSDDFPKSTFADVSKKRIKSIEKMIADSKIVVVDSTQQTEGKIEEVESKKEGIQKEDRMGKERFLNKNIKKTERNKKSKKLDDLESDQIKRDDKNNKHKIIRSRRIKM